MLSAGHALPAFVHIGNPHASFWNQHTCKSIPVPAFAPRAEGIPLLHGSVVQISQSKVIELGLSLAPYHQRGHLTSLYLSFLIHRKGTSTVPSSYGCSGN